MIQTGVTLVQTKLRLSHIYIRWTYYEMNFELIHYYGTICHVETASVIRLHGVFFLRPKIKYGPRISKHVPA